MDPSCVTSKASASAVAGYFSGSHSNCSGLRAVATTLPPAFNTSSASARPNPEEAPVINQTLPACDVLVEFVMDYETPPSRRAMQRGFPHLRTLWPMLRHAVVAGHQREGRHAEKQSAVSYTHLDVYKRQAEAREER